MNIQPKKQKNNKKIPLIFIGILVILVLGGGSAWALTGHSLFGWQPLSKDQSNTSTNSPASPEQIKNGQDIKEQSIKNGGSSGSDQPLAPSTQSDGRNVIGVDITSINKASSSLLKVSTLISYLDQTGSCTLTIKNASAQTVYNQSVGVQAMSNTSTCKGFDIAISNFPSGTYTLNLSYTSADNTTYGLAEKTYALQ